MLTLQLDAKPKLSSFTCPKCYIKNNESMVEGMRVKIFKGACELPHCDLSQSIEDGLSKTLSKAYEGPLMQGGWGGSRGAT